MELKISLTKDFCTPRDVAKAIWENMVLADELGFKMQVNQIGTKYIGGLDIDYINMKVCNYYNIPLFIFHTNTRKREIVQARQIAMYFAKSFTNQSLESIGLQIGEKDHATVLHACKTVNNLLDYDKRFKLQVDEIERRLKQSI